MATNNKGNKADKKTRMIRINCMATAAVMVVSAVAAALMSQVY